MIILIGFKEFDPTDPEEVEVSLIKNYSPNVAEEADRRYHMWRLAHIDETAERPVVLEGMHG